MIGLGSYAFFWQHSDRVEQPLTLIDELHATRELGVSLFQICDYEPLERMSDSEIKAASQVAHELGIEIELGTKGISPEKLSTYLNFAEKFDAKLIRSMVFGPDSHPSLGQAAEWLSLAAQKFEAADVTLALETYEQIATKDLVKLVKQVSSSKIGICLDPANVVARLELPFETVALTAPYVLNVHVKDFQFARQEGWVGFTYSGAEMGHGQHDYPKLRNMVKPHSRGINEIVEHWLPWQGDPQSTITMEREWTRSTVQYLRSL